MTLHEIEKEWKAISGDIHRKREFNQRLIDRQALIFNLLLDIAKHLNRIEWNKK